MVLVLHAHYDHLANKIKAGEFEIENFPSNNKKTISKFGNRREPS